MTASPAPGSELDTWPQQGGHDPVLSPLTGQTAQGDLLVRRLLRYIHPAPTGQGGAHHQG